MKHYLVTGIAGTGKSTLRNAFRDKGYKTIDIDEGYAHWVNRETGAPAVYSADEVMILKHDWLLNAEKLSEYLRSAEQSVFVFGSAHDLYKYTPWFDKVFLLQYPDEQTLRDRILNREGNDYGKAPGELESIIGYQAEYDERFIEQGAALIDCTLPISRVTDSIIKSAE